MESLYCPKCNNYLMVGSGDCIDCYCGWEQPKEKDMCCEPCGSDLPEAGDCPDCGGPVDIDGDTKQACAYSPVDCETCGSAPCDDSC